jgi:hypothetical protein
MSNSHSDDLASIIIPDADTFDWDALKTKVETFDPRSVDSTTLLHAFIAYADREELATDEDEDFDGEPIFGHDLGDWRGYDGHPAQPLTDKDVAAINTILLEDYELIHERALNPGAHIRESDNYQTFGYGFSTMNVAGNLILTGSYNEYCAAAGEVVDWWKMENQAFERFSLLGLLAAPDQN